MNNLVIYCINLFLLLNFVCCDDLFEKCTFTDGTLEKERLNLLSKEIFPDLDGKSRKKGDDGKIGVIGGSIEYTGAPYFSAITALKVGSDLAYVITTENAALVIKTYSPDLIVYPILKPNNVNKIKSLMPKMDVIIIGPGLGREDETLQLVYDIIAHCKYLRKPLVLDADALYALSKNISIIKDYPQPGVILTPNNREANKLEDAISNKDGEWYTYWGKYVSVLVKGEEDRFYSNSSAYNWNSKKGGSGRRVGGQGDILSGALGTFYNWAVKSTICETNNLQLGQSVASYAAAKFTRMCNFLSFSKIGRSATASDMLMEIPLALRETFLGNNN